MQSNLTEAVEKYLKENDNRLIPVSFTEGGEVRMVSPISVLVMLEMQSCTPIDRTKTVDEVIQEARDTGRIFPKFVGEEIK